MQKLIASCADDLGLAAETLASKRDLSALIFGGDRAAKVMTGWRQALVGDELLKLL
jgi:ribonuclease D